MLPGKTLTPEDIAAILYRRIWLILVPLALFAALSAVAVLVLPSRYRSETVILVVPQRIPESYVKSTVTAKIEDRLPSISQEILSRTRLERIIKDFNLYADKRQSGRVMEEVVAEMRDDISVQIVKGDAFRVAYIGQNPRTVMEVTNRLASLFIEENLHDRKVLANDTNEFLEAQLEEARRRLVDHEKKLEGYRKQFSGELPSQVASNIQTIQNIQVQLQSLTESVNRDRDRRLLIERELQSTERDSEEERPIEALPGLPIPLDLPAGGSVSQRLVTARASLASMELSMKPDHPDVKQMRRVISELEAQVDSSQPASEPGSAAAAAPSPISTMSGKRRERAASLGAEMGQLDRQLALKDAEEKRLRALADTYQQRVERLPTRESELAELTRDYSTLQTIYAALLSKQQESKIAANLESRQIGEQFKLLDTARVAEKPFSPRRSRLIATGTAVGLAIGFALAAFLEYRVRHFRSDNDLIKALTLPVLAVVPLMESDMERRLTYKRRLVVGCGLGGLVATCFSVVVYVLLT